MLEIALAENQDGKFLVLRNDTLGQHLLRGERWEPHFTDLVSKIVPTGSIVVDVGANIGYNAVVLARAVGDSGKVIAFEPLRVPFQQLCGNAILNSLENIVAHNVVVGSLDNRPVSMVPVDYHEKDINIMNSCVGVGGEVVMMRTLDSYNLEGVSFIKIDVQGCELLVLNGAETTIQQNRPLLFIEIEEVQLQNKNTSSKEVMLKILSMNYQFVYNQSVALFDWVAVPAENKRLLEQVCAAMGPGHQVFGVPSPQ